MRAHPNSKVHKNRVRPMLSRPGGPSATASFPRSDAAAFGQWTQSCMLATGRGVKAILRETLCRNLAYTWVVRVGGFPHGRTGWAGNAVDTLPNYDKHADDACCCLRPFRSTPIEMFVAFGTHRITNQKQKNNTNN